MRRSEEQHNTPEQVRTAIAGALAIVLECQVPPPLLEVAFGKAIDLLASKQIFFEQPQTMPLPAMDLSRMRQ